MKKGTVAVLAMLVVSSVLIANTLFGTSVDPLAGRDYAFFVTSLVFSFSFIYLVYKCFSRLLEIWPMIGYAGAVIWVVASLSALIVSIAFILVSRWKIFPNWVHDLLVIVALLSFLSSALNLRKWPPD
jgi:hypothetical protein